MAYVPGNASGKVRRDTYQADCVALVGLQEALTPHQQPAAYLIVEGAPFSHPMISLVAQKVPTVIISAAQASLLESGMNVRVDGALGLITLAPKKETPDAALPPLPPAGHPIHLSDGTEVSLMASVRSAAQARDAYAHGACAIGLVRSEFLGWARKQPPKVAFYRDAFAKLLASANGLPVTIRLLDIAADKPPHWLPNARKLLAPMGMQGARLFHKAPVHHVLQNQLEALAPLAEQQTLEVLIPFVTSREELLHWSGIVHKALPQGVPVGAMLESPASILDMENWGSAVDFFGVGCNDLMQYLFAADRDAPELSHALSPYAPVLYRVLREALESAGDRKDGVRLCGVLPRIPNILPLLIGLGYRRFSVDPVWIPYLAQTLHSLKTADTEALANQVCASRDVTQVRNLLT